MGILDVFFLIDLSCNCLYCFELSKCILLCVKECQLDKHALKTKVDLGCNVYLQANV